MSLVPSLLQAIVKADGDALVMHPGDKPYVVSPGGQVELASRGLTLDAVNGIVGQLLPAEIQGALEEFGAIQYHLPPRPEFPGEHFTIVAARGGDDVWVEVRRRRVVDDRVPEEMLAPVPAAEQPLRLPVVAEIPVLTTTAAAHQPAAAHAAASVPEASARVDAGHQAPLSDDDLMLPDAEQLWPARNDEWEKREAARALDGDEIDIDLDADLDEERQEIEPIPHTAVAEHEAAAAREGEATAAAERAAAERAAAEREAAERDAAEREAAEREAIAAAERAAAERAAAERAEAERAEAERVATERAAAERAAAARAAAERAAAEREAAEREAIAAAERAAAAAAEREALAAAEREAIAAAEREAIAAARREAEARAAVEREAIAAAERESIAAARREAEARAVSEREAIAAAEREAIASARREAEARGVSEREAIATAEREAIAAARREAEARAVSEREAIAAAERETIAAARREAEARGVSEREAIAAVEREAIAAARREAEARAVSEREAIAAAAREAIAAARREAETRAATEREAIAAAEREAIAAARRDAEARAAAEREAIVAAERTAIAAARREAEARAAAEHEAIAAAERHAIAAARREAEARAAAEHEAIAAAEREAIAAARREAETRAAAEHEAIAAAQREAIAAARREAEARAAAEREAIAVAEREAIAVARREAAAAAAEREAIAAAGRAAVERAAAERETADREAVAAAGRDASAAADARVEPVADLPTMNLETTAEQAASEKAAAPPAPPPAPTVTFQPRTERPVPAVPIRDASAGSRAVPPAAHLETPPSAVVLPISRSPIRADHPVGNAADPTLPGLERLLRVSAARGASTLYLSSDSQPSIRVDGELQMLDAEPVHTSRDVESLLLSLMPERSHEALRTGAVTEWICDIDGIGRVRCMSFRDHRGPGGVFRLMPTRTVSVDQLALPRHVQSLAIEPEGLVLVAGPRSSGKRTLMAAFVDLMNRARRDHIITIEREINIVHERGHSFISQREVRGNDDDLLAAARAALREDPDVLVIEELRTGALMNVALEAVAAGRLVIGGFSAHTATEAIDRIIDLYAPEYRREVQFALAESLRGVVVQVLLRKIGGGRLPARELLLNTPTVSSVIADGKTSQLPMAIEGGRRYGMMPLNDALVSLVQSGAVEPREAYRQSPDRPGFLAALNRQGIDTSFVERLA